MAQAESSENKQPEIEVGFVYRVSDDVYIAPQVSDEQLETLASAKSIKSVVNLRRTDENSFSLPERELIQKLGLRYFHVPMSGPDLRISDKVDHALATIDEAPKPVLVHCAGMVRAAAVGVMWTGTRQHSQLPDDFISSTLDSAGHSQAAQGSVPPPLRNFVQSYADDKVMVMKSLPGFEVVSDKLVVGPQFTEDQLDTLLQHGIKSVLNIRNPDIEAGSVGVGVLAREPELVQARGLVYRNVPTTWRKKAEELPEQEINQVIQAFHELPKPVLLHDRTANRVKQVLQVLKRELSGEAAS